MVDFEVDTRVRSPSMSLATLALLWVVPTANASTGSCGSTPHASDNEFVTNVVCTSDGPSEAAHGPSVPVKDRWILLCSVLVDAERCDGPASCPEGMDFYAHQVLLDGEWINREVTCRSTASPTITPALVSTAFQRIPLPRLRTIAQPATKTLVNFDTIFHVEADPLRRDVTLLGQRIELDITPSSFTWTWGDGQSDTTHTPGAAYPSRAVVHRYLDADVTVEATVTVTWTARWRVNGGAWADVPGSVRTTGPAATLRVVEAVPNLAGPG